MIFRQRSGFTLVEVLIVMGVTSALAYTASQVAEYTERQIQSVAANNDFASLVNLIQGFINNSNDCKKLFRRPENIDPVTKLITANTDIFGVPGSSTSTRWRAPVARYAAPARDIAPLVFPSPLSNAGANLVTYDWGAFQSLSLINEEYGNAFQILLNRTAPGSNAGDDFWPQLGVDNVTPTLRISELRFNQVWNQLGTDESGNDRLIVNLHLEATRRVGFRGTLTHDFPMIVSIKYNTYGGWGSIMSCSAWENYWSYVDPAPTQDIQYDAGDVYIGGSGGTGVQLYGKGRLQLVKLKTDTANSVGNIELTGGNLKFAGGSSTLMLLPGIGPSPIPSSVTPNPSPSPGGIYIGPAPAPFPSYPVEIRLQQPKTLSGARYYWFGSGDATTDGFTGSAQIALNSTGAFAALFAVATSDRRLKQDISPWPVERSREFLHSARPVSYAWKSTSEGQLGFIAQELLAAGFPELVTMAPNSKMRAENDPSGVLSPAGAQLSLLYSGVTSILTQVAQVLSHQLSQRQNDLAAFRQSSVQIRDFLHKKAGKSDRRKSSGGGIKNQMSKGGDP